MRAQTADEKARKKTEAISGFRSTCDRLAYAAASSDSYTDGLGTWSTETAGIACGFELQKQQNRETGQMEILTGQAVLRVALTQALDVKDRIRAGGNVWEIDGIHTGETVKVVDLKKAVTDG